MTDSTRYSGCFKDTLSIALCNGGGCRNQTMSLEWLGGIDVSLIEE
ncbi:hypothetical protein ACFLTZ_03705 [Chloroflexota bacterium]